MGGPSAAETGIRDRRELMGLPRSKKAQAVLLAPPLLFALVIAGALWWSGRDIERSVLEVEGGETRECGVETCLGLASDFVGIEVREPGGALVEGLALTKVEVRPGGEGVDPRVTLEYRSDHSPSATGVQLEVAVFEAPVEPPRGAPPFPSEDSGIRAWSMPGPLGPILWLRSDTLTARATGPTPGEPTFDDGLALYEVALSMLTD